MKGNGVVPYFLGHTWPCVCDMDHKPDILGDGVHQTPTCCMHYYCPPFRWIRMMGNIPTQSDGKRDKRWKAVGMFLLRRLGQKHENRRRIEGINGIVLWNYRKGSLGQIGQDINWSQSLLLVTGLGSFHCIMRTLRGKTRNLGGYIQIEYYIYSIYHLHFITLQCSFFLL